LSLANQAAYKYRGFQNQIKECFILISLFKAFFEWGVTLVGN